MASLLVHVTTGPEDQTKAALSFLVAKTALAAGHRVSLFLAGEAVRLLDAENLQTVEGLGTGNLQQHYDDIVAAGGQFYLSGMSSKARGYDDSLLEGKPAQYAMPDKLVELTIESDKTIVY